MGAVTRSLLCPAINSVQWKVLGGSPEGTLAWVHQKGCFGADDKVVLASTGREVAQLLFSYIYSLPVHSSKPAGTLAKGMRKQAKTTFGANNNL